MSQLFSETGQSKDVAVSVPPLLGNFLAAMDNPSAGDGFGVIYPWGGASTLRKYESYGTDSGGNTTSTTLSDLTGNLISTGGGLSVNIEGLVGPQGPAGRDGLPGTPGTPYGLYAPTGLLDISNSLKQIEELGTEADMMIYTSGNFAYWNPNWILLDEIEYYDNECADIAMDDDGSFAVLVGGHGVFVSNDFGVTWSRSLSSGSGWFPFVDCDSDGSHLITTNPYNKYVYVSVNGGDSWTTYNLPEYGLINAPYSCCVNGDGSIMWASRRGKRLYKTTNYGASWTGVTSGDATGIWDILECSDSGQYILCGDSTPGRLWTSNDYGVTWLERRPSGSDVSVYWRSGDISSTGQCMVVVGDSYAGIENCFISKDYGVSWTGLHPTGTDLGADGDWDNVGLGNGGQIIIVTKAGRGVYCSFDYGDSWNLQNIAATGPYDFTVGIARAGAYGIVGNNGKEDEIFISGGISYTQILWDETTITEFARSLVDDLTAEATRDTLELGEDDTPEFADLTLTGLEGIMMVSSGEVSASNILDLGLSF